MNIPYRIGYPKAFIGFGKPSCGKIGKLAPVSICELCPQLTETLKEFTGHDITLTVCPKHYNEQTNALIGELQVA